MDPTELQVGAVKEHKDGKRQLLLDVRARGSDGRKLVLRVLVDTGAEANLVRKGLVTPELLKPAKTPLTLVTADGSRMEGGSREVTLQLCFASTTPNEAGKPEWCTRATFHEADIRVDAILSCPWMDSEQLGVFPHLEALARVNPDDPAHIQLLRDWPTRKRKPVKGHQVSNRTVTTRVPQSGWSTRTIHSVTEWEEFQGRLTKVRAMNVHLPSLGGAGGREPLADDEDALEFVAGKLQKDKPSKASASSVVQVPDAETPPNPLIKDLVASLHRDYDGSVLREDVPAENIIPRGPFGFGRIDLKPGAQPKRSRPIHLVGERRQALVDVIEEKMRRGQMEDGQGAWSSPAFVVAKKVGKWRIVVDFRALNEATITDSYPLPRIEDTLVRFGRKGIFSIMDLKDAFHQVPLDPTSKHLTCTSTPLGSKQWKVVVMGLKNGVAIFQRVVDFCLNDVKDVASPYVDNIIIGTEAKDTWEKTVQAHDRHIRCLLEALQ